jgi:Domain of unknown function (DUF4124)
VVSSKAIVIGMLAAGHISSAALAQSIYSCVDANGRKLTSDRPIADCVDRTQRELSPQGTTRRIVGPTLTARELAAQEVKEKTELESRAFALEEKRRDRALLSRYPNRAVHDKERAQAIEQVNEVIKASAKRSNELSEQRAAINLEMEFYKKDPSKAPQAIKRRVEENDSSTAVQRSFLAEQDLEKQRVNLRFDEELVKLKQLWAMAGGAAPPVLAAPATNEKSVQKKP